MKITPTPLAGAVLIELQRIEDERGFFARTYCRETFASAGLEPRIAQCSLSYSHRRGTLRGLHYQAAPYEECKLVRCLKGALYDVIVDLRSDSPTYGRWHGVELDAESRHQLFVPGGFAHGFQTLANDTEVFYQMSTAYRGECQRGVHYADPALAIDWPLEISVISERDQKLPSLAEVQASQ